jgi:hypothetical protein
MGLFSAYVLTLDAGGWPHDEHAHVDEEILIPLAPGSTGEGSSRQVEVANLDLEETEALRGIRRRRIWTGRPLTSGSTMTVESVCSSSLPGN